MIASGAWLAAASSASRPVRAVQHLVPPGPQVDAQRAHQLGLILHDEDHARPGPAGTGGAGRPLRFRPDVLPARTRPAQLPVLADSSSRAMLSSSTFTVGSPRKPSCRPWMCCVTRLRTSEGRQVPGRGHPVDLHVRVRRRDVRVEAGPRRGHRVRRYLRDRHVVERGDLLLPLLDQLTWVGLVGPSCSRTSRAGRSRSRSCPRLTIASEGRGWKYCGSGLPLASTNSWHSRPEPTTGRCSSPSSRWPGCGRPPGRRPA